MAYAKAPAKLGLMPVDCGTQACGGGPPEGAGPCRAPQNAQKAVPSFREAPHVEHLIIVLL